MSVSQDGSESVDQFLARIASVREGRDQASEERTKRLEEDFLKNRKERQARRLERARSLSPSKTGPSLSGATSQSPALSRDTALNPPIDFSPRTSTLSRSNAVSARTSPKLEPKRADTPVSPLAQNAPSPASAAAGLSRSGTLSWQQRPPRDGAGNRPRPFSTIETIRPVPKAEEEQGEQTSEPSRQEIAVSLGLKDPSWFRQTQDRGLGSAAYRKNQVEDSETVQHSMRSQGLPGMSEEDLKSVDKTPVRNTERALPQREPQLSPTPALRVKRESSPVTTFLSDTPKLEPSPQQTVHSELKSDSRSNLARTGSTRAARSPSPTKGLGGFVESAMMKRSDSVSKRWSVQANSGLKRGDSTASARPLSGVRSMHTSTLSRSTNQDRSPSPAVTSRPNSRDGATNIKSRSVTPDRKDDSEKAPTTISQPISSDASVRPKTPPDDQLARSPSKTFDTRRWSPTKSSWLESALLSKPDPPKPLPIKEEIPAWKASLQRNKASKDLSPEKSKPDDADSRSPLTQDSSRAQKAPVVARKPDLISTESSTTKLDSNTTDQTKGAAADKVEKSTGAVIGSEPIIPDTLKLEKPPFNTVEVTSTKTNVEEKPPRKPPLTMKPKPQTPPKTDFRATLRSRAPATVDETVSEPEFKSVFGKLKPTQTLNYIAPDTLKSNILSSKAALNVTDGPQKSQRVDEFKESILQKKEAMKASTIKTKESPLPPPQSSKPASDIPEALARRKTLHKTTPSLSKPQDTIEGPQLPIREHIQPTPATKPRLLPIQPPTTKLEASNKPPSVARGMGIKQQLSSLKPDSLRSKPDDSPVGPKQKIESEDLKVLEAKPVTQTLTMPSAQVISELPVGSKLASRLNPNLATFLTRGGSPSLSESKSMSPERLNNEVSKQNSIDAATTEPLKSGELTHMTKGRAKGPKRRAPKSQPTQTTKTSEPFHANPAQEATRNTQRQTPTVPKKATSTLQTNPKPITAINSTPAVQFTKPVPDIRDQKSDDNENKPSLKPAVANKSPELRKTSTNSSAQQVDGPAARPSTPAKFEIATDDDVVNLTTTQPSQHGQQITPKPTISNSPLTPSKSRVNSPRPLQGSANQSAKSEPPKPVASLGLSVKSSPLKPAISKSELTPPPDPPRKPSSTIKVPQKGSQDEDISPIISAYFAKMPDKQHRADFDAQMLLVQAKESGEKIKSLSHNIWEIYGDGKKSTMPQQQEHILFEESLYLITHTFESSGSKVSEVYLWCGDGVADAAIEDAQLFCRKDAREHNAKLEVIRQGREPARFFQALGGILIVRRNKSSSLYMLRGRRHLGHIAFDEIDLTASNLCSGFPYLISAKFGKLYLWKGKGCGADEVGCARLIGMDLGLTGEIEEITEGSEPSSFWESFTQREKNNAFSNDWRRRAEHDCYPTTLYRVDIDRPKAATSGFWGLARAASPSKPSNKVAIEVVSPFSDRDLEPSNVYVLDAYRSIYVILDSRATDKSTEVVTALHLAQELAMLSPSIQDRSLLPACFVSFGEPPADVKVCFRKWSSEEWKSKTPSRCVKLERVLEALQL